jgi:oxygen-independent coproporphyrinogen-3 oxidase
MPTDRVALSPALLAEDAVVFGLRLNAGVDLTPWRAHAPDVPWQAVGEQLDRREAAGFAVQRGSSVRLTDRGRLLADAIGVELMSAFEG